MRKSWERVRQGSVSRVRERSHEASKQEVTRLPARF